MSKVGSLKYSLELGFVRFYPFNESTSFRSEIMEDGLYINLYFNKVEESIANQAFLNSLLRFSAATVLVNKLCDGVKASELTSNQEDMIKKEASKAAFSFKTEIKALESATNINEVLSLSEYIIKYFNGSQSAFAKAQAVQPAQITQWLKKEFIVVDNGLYSHRRELEN